MTVDAVFLACHKAIRTGVLITRASGRDKEFHFQDWFAGRLGDCQLAFDDPGRNSYPDFRLVNSSIGFEVKGLAFPGRMANYDCNSQVPSGWHNGRRIFYVFGRYPKSEGSAFPAYDLVICDGDFLNADHEYIHENKNIKGFGSYGDLMIRDRKMYVAPTPFALTSGTAGQITLILRDGEPVDSNLLRQVGKMEREEAAFLIAGYTFNLQTNKLDAQLVPNPNAGRKHGFLAYREVSDLGPQVDMDKACVDETSNDDDD